MNKKALHELYAEHTGKWPDKWFLYLPNIVAYFISRYGCLRSAQIMATHSRFGQSNFTSASILIGCDANPECASLSFGDPRIVVIVGDGNINEAQFKTMKYWPEFPDGFGSIEDGEDLLSDILPLVQYRTLPFRVRAFNAGGCPLWKGRQDNPGTY
jgi:O-antigen biosynthesis protein